MVLINHMKVDPANRDALLALLEQNIRSVVSTLAGWKSSRLIAAADGAAVIIYSEWDSAEAIAAMRGDPRMQAYFPQIRALAQFDSVAGMPVFDYHPGVPEQCEG